jgi:hypothetical protein
LLMIGASMSVIWYYYRRVHNRPERWQWLYAPALGGVALIVILAITLLNVNALTGSVADVQWLLPGIVAAAAAIGAGWALVLRVTRPGVYTAIGYGQPKPLAVLDRSLSHLEL